MSNIVNFGESKQKPDLKDTIGILKRMARDCERDIETMTDNEDLVSGMLGKTFGLKAGMNSIIKNKAEQSKIHLLALNEAIEILEAIYEAGQKGADY